MFWFVVVVVVDDVSLIPNDKFYLSLELVQLGKSVVAGRDLKKGEKLSLDNILVKCAEPHGIRPNLLDQLLGTKRYLFTAVGARMHVRTYVRIRQCKYAYKLSSYT